MGLRVDIFMKGKSDEEGGRNVSGWDDDGLRLASADEQPEDKTSGEIEEGSTESALETAEEEE